MFLYYPNTDLRFSMASSFDMEQQGFHEAFSGGNNGENNCITSVRNVSLVNNIDESDKTDLMISLGTAVCLPGSLSSASSEILPGRKLVKVLVQTVEGCKAVLTAITNSFQLASQGVGVLQWDPDRVSFGIGDRVTQSLYLLTGQLFEVLESACSSAFMSGTAIFITTDELPSADDDSWQRVPCVANEQQRGRQDHDALRRQQLFDAAVRLGWMSHANAVHGWSQPPTVAGGGAPGGQGGGHSPFGWTEREVDGLKKYNIPATAWSAVRAELVNVDQSYRTVCTLSLMLSGGCPRPDCSYSTTHGAPLSWSQRKAVWLASNVVPI